ncbi:helix-turn-helix domain-containing protein [Chloroflexota bacterium]
MAATITVAPQVSLGYDVWHLRQHLRLTRHELATLAGVTARDISSFENGLPLQMEARRRLLQALWDRKTGQESADSEAMKALAFSL